MRHVTGGVAQVTAKAAYPDRLQAGLIADRTATLITPLPHDLQATSSLDGLTERRMQESLASMRQRTRHARAPVGIVSKVQCQHRL